MGARAVVETGRDRKALVADAGFKELSFISVAAGVVAAYGMFALLAGLAAGVIAAADAEIDLASNWRDLGMAGGLVVAGLLLVAYLFGGYVAGRMARRAGALHGIVVFVLGAAVVVAAAFVARELGGADVASSNLRGLGVPTTAAEWRDVATIAGIASLAAMLLGALLGGILGERWHAKLLSRALDPEIGAEAEARRDAELRAAEAEELRTAAFRRVRATTPNRTRRVDTVDDTGDTRVAPQPSAVGGRTDRDTDRGVDVDGDGNADRRRGSLWWRRLQPRDDAEGTGARGDTVSRR
ncbi:MAG: hypothetical protein M3144_02275 [Actinomycetota bacterium]|nr:hypothetical protein [Actinomycetota bacterium]